MRNRGSGCLRIIGGLAGGAVIILVVLALVLATHTQIIVGAIQSLSASTVKTTNTFEPESERLTRAS